MTSRLPRRSTRLRGRRASATPGAVVEALSRCLEDIAVQIAKDVRAF